MVIPSLKERLAAGNDRLFGTHISLSDPLSSAAISHSGYDFVIIDADNTESSYTSLRNHLANLGAGGTPVLVRLLSNTETHLSRVLELGPDGLIFTDINTPEEARLAVSQCLYPPHGKRHWNPLRSAAYRIEDSYENTLRDSRLLCLMLQLSSAQAIRNLSEIIKIANIDGFFCSLSNLSAADGTPKDIFGADTQQLLRAASRLLEQNHKPLGVSLYNATAENLKFWRGLGVRLIGSGSDAAYIADGARDNLKTLKNLTTIPQINNEHDRL